MEHGAEFFRCMDQLDVEGTRRLWAAAGRHLHQPKNNHEALATLHYARTVSEAMTFKQRAYSHAWLLDFNLPSGLPDELKPKAEQLHPRVVRAVGISVNTSSPLLEPIKEEIRAAMSDAVEEAFADRRTDTPFVSMRMAEARQRAVKKLVGV